jgi:hypothetical protein
MRRPVAIVATVSTLVGPVAALLYENGHLRVFPNYHGKVAAVVSLVVNARGARALRLHCRILHARRLSLKAARGAR